MKCFANEDLEFGRNQDEWQILKPKPLRADSFTVSELVRKLADARMDLTASDNDNKLAAQAFAHATPVATARLTDESGTQELQIRKNTDHQNNDRQKTDTYYAKSSVVDGVYKVGSDFGQALDKGLDDFRNKKLFDFGYDDPNKIELHAGSKAYFLTRGAKSEDWRSNGKKMDADAVQAFIAKLRDLSADKFLDSGFTSPAVEISVLSNAGKRIEHVSFAKVGDGYIGKRDNDSTLYQISAGSIDDLQKAADAIKPAAPPAK